MIAAVKRLKATVVPKSMMKEGVYPLLRANDRRVTWSKGTRVNCQNILGLTKIEIDEPLVRQTVPINEVGLNGAQPMMIMKTYLIEDVPVESLKKNPVHSRFRRSDSLNAPTKEVLLNHGERS